MNLQTGSLAAGRSKSGFVLLWTLVGALFAFAHVRLAWTDGDEGRYLALAHAVSQGLGQVEEYYPEPQPETLTPSGYVYYLGAWVKAFGMNLGWVRLSSVLPFVLFVAAFALFVRRRLDWPDWLAGCVVVFGALQVQVLRYAWNLMTEAPFLCLVFLCFALQERERKTALEPWLLGGLAAMSTLVRPVGIALAIAGGLHCLLRKRWKDLAAFCIAFGLVYVLEIIRTWRLLGVPFAYMTHYHSGPSGLRSGLAVLGNMWQGWLGYFFRSMPEDLFFSFFGSGGLLGKLRLDGLSAAGMGLVAVVVAAGFLRNVRRMQMAEWFWLFYWAMFCTYNAGSDPVPEGGFHFQPRYLAPVLPLAALYFAVGTDWIFRALGRGRAFAVPCRNAVVASVGAYALLTSLLVGGICLKNTWRYRGLAAWAPERVQSSGNEDDLAFARYIETAGWIAAHLPDNAVIGSRKPQHTLLFSGRKGFRYDMDWLDGECRDAWENAVAYGKYGPVYLLQDAFPATGGYGNTRVHVLDPAIAAHESELDLVHSTPPPVTRLWQIRATAPPSP